MYTIVASNPEAFPQFYVWYESTDSYSDGVAYADSTESPPNDAWNAQGVEMTFDDYVFQPVRANLPRSSSRPAVARRRWLPVPPPLAPSTALADKAVAIQGAVNSNPSQVAIACAGITNYVGLVKGQTGKKLSLATVGVLTTDANSLAEAPLSDSGGNMCRVGRGIPEPGRPRWGGNFSIVSAA